VPRGSARARARARARGGGSERESDDRREGSGRGAVGGGGGEKLTAHRREKCMSDRGGTASAHREGAVLLTTLRLRTLSLLGSRPASVLTDSPACRAVHIFVCRVRGSRTGREGEGGDIGAGARARYAFD